MSNILLVNGSTLVVLRAGYANILVFLLLITVSLSNVVVSQFTQALWIRGLVTAVLIVIFVRLYWSAISRIDVRDDRIVITMSLSTKTIPVSDIVSWKLFEFPLGYAARIRFRLASRKLPFSVSFVAPYTNRGDFRSTVKFLRESLDKI